MNVQKNHLSMLDKYASKISYYGSILAIGWIIILIIISNFEFADEYLITSIGFFILIGPFLGLALLTPGIIGYRRKKELKKAKIGMVTGIAIISIAI